MRFERLTIKKVPDVSCYPKRVPQNQMRFESNYESEDLETQLRTERARREAAQQQAGADEAFRGGLL